MAKSTEYWLYKFASLAAPRAICLSDLLLWNHFCALTEPESLDFEVGYLHWPATPWAVSLNDIGSRIRPNDGLFAFQSFEHYSPLYDKRTSDSQRHLLDRKHRLNCAAAGPVLAFVR